MAAIDHLMYGVSDLDAGVDALETLLGVRAAPGGSHPGWGTRNALLSLGKDVYLEIIAPDPAQPLDRNFGGRLRELEQPGLITWAVNVRGLASAAQALNDAGLEASGPVPMSREDPKLGRLDWELLFVGGHDLGLAVPFLIDWLKCPHPSNSTPSGCALESLELLSPNPDALRKAMKAIGLDLPITSAESVGIQATFSSPKGNVTLTRAAPLPDALF